MLVSSPMQGQEDQISLRHTGHKCDTEPESSDNPSRDGQGTDEVRAEVRRLEAAGLAGGDVESTLEMGIQDIE